MHLFYYHLAIEPVFGFFNSPRVGGILTVMSPFVSRNVFVVPYAVAYCTERLLHCAPELTTGCKPGAQCTAGSCFAPLTQAVSTGQLHACTVFAIVYIGVINLLSLRQIPSQLHS